MEIKELTPLNQEELVILTGGSKSPKEWLEAFFDWLADGIGYVIADHGAQVAGSVYNGGNAAAVVAYK